jgi:hypothetical protein
MGVCVCVCVYVCIFGCMYVCVLYMYSIYVCMYVWLYVRIIYECMCVCIHYVCMYECLYILYMYVCVYKHIYYICFDPLQRWKDFSTSLCVQTDSGAHPASCTMGTGGKARPSRDADRSPHRVPRSRMSRRYTSSPPKRLWRVVGQL